MFFLLAGCGMLLDGRGDAIARGASPPDAGARGDGESPAGGGRSPHGSSSSNGLASPVPGKSSWTQ
jgi:hypothetical protein